MSFFFRDVHTEVELSWDNLIANLRQISTYNPYVLSNRFEVIFEQIIASMLLGKPIILLDSDFSEEELEKLTNTKDFSVFKEEIEPGLILLSDKEDLLKKLKATSDSWSITLFTSGTTGLPKKVVHTFTSITRFVQYQKEAAKHVWGFAYNPTHMAGIQVFFQTLLNGSQIVRLFGLQQTQIHSEIEKCKITHLSATPTFYRLLLPCHQPFHSVIRITSGGEKFNPAIMAKLEEAFPNARITNVYASTEAGTLFASENDIFSIKSTFESLVKITDEGELWIHRSLTGSFFTSENEWYNTGDLVEIVAHDPIRFKFLSRKNDMINVGGYKVNPLEVEDVLLTIPGILEARVFSKSNSVLGNLIIAEVVKTESGPEEADIRTHLQGRLQEFKIPRMIRFVDALTITRSGKIKRI